METKTEKIQRYIDRTNIKGNAQAYGLQHSDMRAILEVLQKSPVEGMLLAFNFGRAKGYRAAEKAVRG